eukprot:SAG31_NODE_11939_length_983_cov_2.643665_2_plen_78_part_00
MTLWRRVSDRLEFGGQLRVVGSVAGHTCFRKVSSTWSRVLTVLLSSVMPMVQLLYGMPTRSSAASSFGAQCTLVLVS